MSYLVNVFCIMVEFFAQYSVHFPIGLKQIPKNLPMIHNHLRKRSIAISCLDASISCLRTDHILLCVVLDVCFASS
jgi:hypothetical protein